MIKVLTTPWKEEFLKLVNKSKISIKITSPFVKYDICREMLLAKNRQTRINLITSFKLMSIYSGALDIKALEEIINNNGKIKNYPKLHSKIYLFDDEEAIITSSNLTVGGMTKNFEYGIYIDDSEVVKKISMDFHLLSINEKTGPVTKSSIEIVREILKKLPKSVSAKLPIIDLETPEETLDVIENSYESIQKSLKGWKLEVFNCVHSIPEQVFSLNDINKFENHFKKIYPSNKHIRDKIRQQLQYLRDLGLIEFLGSGRYKKLWK